MRDCENEFIDFTNETNPKCSTKCPSDGLIYIDSITTSGEKRCVSSCKELIPPAYIDIDGVACIRNCENG